MPKTVPLTRQDIERRRLHAKTGLLTLLNQRYDPFARFAPALPTKHINHYNQGATTPLSMLHKLIGTAQVNITRYKQATQLSSGLTPLVSVSPPPQQPSTARTTQPLAIKSALIPIPTHTITDIARRFTAHARHRTPRPRNPRRASRPRPEAHHFQNLTHRSKHHQNTSTL